MLQPWECDTKMSCSACELADMICVTQFVLIHQQMMLFSKHVALRFPEKTYDCFCQVELTLHG